MHRDLQIRACDSPQFLFHFFQRRFPWEAVRNSSRATALLACRSKYDVELYGAEKKIQLPFVMGVMADLAGKPEDPLPPVADRKFLEFDVDNFDTRMKAMKPRVAFTVPNTLTGEGNLSVDLTFENMDDFNPASIAAKSEGLKQLLEAASSSPTW